MTLFRATGLPTLIFVPSKSQASASESLMVQRRTHWNHQLHAHVITEASYVVIHYHLLSQNRFFYSPSKGDKPRINHDGDWNISLLCFLTIKYCFYQILRVPTLQYEPNICKSILLVYLWQCESHLTSKVLWFPSELGSLKVFLIKNCFL